MVRTQVGDFYVLSEKHFGEHFTSQIYFVVCTKCSSENVMLNSYLLIVNNRKFDPFYCSSSVQSFSISFDVLMLYSIIRRIQSQ